MKIRFLLLHILLIATGAVWAADWPNWRGPSLDGTSPEKGLISEWSLNGKNQLWRVDFAGRSTPVVFNNRVYAIGRVGEDVSKQEQLASFDARTGELLWERRFNVFLTTVPFPRVGWSNPTVDPATGHVYFHGVGGLLVCLDRDGRILWEKSLAEEFGRMSGYGGRTHTPIIDGDLLFLTVINKGWGDQAAPRHRVFAFDKTSGAVVWMTTVGGAPEDLNTYSMPVVGTVNGQRLLIVGGADGTVYALRSGTGEVVWSFALSKRGLNASVVLNNNRVYASHSEENLDRAVMGRVVCIDATGNGDVTQTHEVWRFDQVLAGFASPAIENNVLFIMDNSGNLYGLNADTGEQKWKYNVGTVGKGSPVWADGKLYVTETNGVFAIFEPYDDRVELLSRVTIDLGDRMAEIYSSPAISNGRIFFATEEGLYALGDPDSSIRPEGASETVTEEAEPGEVASIQVVPADAFLRAARGHQFEARGYDASGRFVRKIEADWTLQNLEGSIEDGLFTPADLDRMQAGRVIARSGPMEASSRVRVMPNLPFVEDFESYEVGNFPTHWIGPAGRFEVKQEDGNKVLSKPQAGRGIQRSYVYVGPADMKAYAVQVDLLGKQDGRKIPDMGLIANRYILGMIGSRQELFIHSWASELRMAKSVPFPWEANVWYTMKMQVDADQDQAIVRGKVWEKSEPEPAEWSIEARDPYPNRVGSPGILGQSYAEIYYDNFKITEKE